MASNFSPTDLVELSIRAHFSGRWDPEDLVQQKGVQKIIDWYQKQIPGTGAIKGWTNLGVHQILKNATQSGLLDYQFQKNVVEKKSLMVEKPDGGEEKPES